MDKKILFLGGGNMAEGIMKGLIQSGTATAESITVKEPIQERCRFLSQTYGVTALTDAKDAIKAADLLIIAVNPPQVPRVTEELRNLISDRAIVMSIAAGVTIAALEDQLGCGKKVARMMPNTLSLSGDGYSAICKNSCIDDEDDRFLTEIVSSLGQVMHITEDMFDTFTGFCCTTPFWLYKMTEALIDAGVYAGFRRSEARDMVIKNMLGTAKVLEMTGAHPTVKVDELTSPGGVTIEALKVLQEKGFAPAVMASVDAAVKKANSFQ